MSPIRTLPLAIGLGVAGAIAVVIFHTLLTDVVGGVLGVVALIVVTWSAIQLAGETGAPPDDTL
jgi:hypothetical protein